MWCEIIVPDFGVAACATVVRLHCEPGDHLTQGSAVVDLEVDLSAGLLRDCPPTSTCRIVTGEDLWLRAIHIAPGTSVQPGGLIAELSTDPDDVETAGRRTARFSAVAILHHPHWWSGP